MKGLVEFEAVTTEEYIKELEERIQELERKVRAQELALSLWEVVGNAQEAEAP